MWCTMYMSHRNFCHCMLPMGYDQKSYNILLFKKATWKNLTRARNLLSFSNRDITVTGKKHKLVCPTKVMIKLNAVCHSSSTYMSLVETNWSRQCCDKINKVHSSIVLPWRHEQLWNNVLSSPTKTKNSKESYTSMCWDNCAW